MGLALLNSQFHGFRYILSIMKIVRTNFVNLKNKLKTSFSFWFTIIAVVIFEPFYGKGLSFIWNVDGVGQYYPAFIYIGQWLRNQISNIFSFGCIERFDLKIAMGENVISSLNYYGFGDPLNILSIFSNTDNGAYVFSAMVILRLYLAGVSFKKYSRYMALDETMSTIAALSYVFCGYALYGGMMYIEFLSPLIYFPMILYGCEKIWKEHKFSPLIISFLYASLCNLYFVYMVSLYLIMYCLIRTFFFYNHNLKVMSVNCLKCALSAVIGFILSLPISFWFIQGLLFSTRSDISVIDVIFNIDNWKPSIDKIIRYFGGFLPLKWYWGNIPVVVCIVLVISLFLWKDRKQKQCAVACWIGPILVALPITYALFSGFSGAYDRWYFLLVFSYLIVFTINGNRIIESKFRDNKIAIKKLMTVICVVNIMIGGFLLYSTAGIGFSDEFIPFRSAKMYTDSPVNYSETIRADTDIYRVSNDSLTGINGRPENIAMLNDYCGLTFWFSVVNKNTQEIVNRLNTDNQNDWRSFGLKNSLLYESMAGVKYYLRHENNVYPPEYEFIEQIDFYGEKWEIYRNPYALPMIYAFTEDYYEHSLEKEYYAESSSVLANAIKAENIEMQLNKISAEINVPKDACVLLAIPFSEQWKAYVDDENTEVFQSNILYAAIKLPKGKHTIVFQY